MLPLWMLDALCRHFSTMPWIAEPHERTREVEAAMRAVCLACPVGAACAAYVDEAGVSSRFWAGCDRTPTADVDLGNGAA